MFRNLRYALRMLRRNPGFAAIAIVSLALGIGVNAAMFSFADALVLRPLPVVHPGEVVTLSGTAPNIPGTGFGSLSYPDYLDLRDQVHSLDGLTAIVATPVGVAADAKALPKLRLAMMVSGNFFETMKVPAALGRTFTPDEDRVKGRDAVAVLGHDFWEKQLGSDPHIAGRELRLNGVRFTVIGVAPAEFTGIDTFVRPDLYLPIAMLPRVGTEVQAKLLDDRGTRAFEVKGRLKPGVSFSQAEAELAGTARNLAQAHPDTNRNRGIRLMTEMQVRAAQSPPNTALARMLLAVAGLVLLIACANVANLLLSRARMRSREITVRLAIGASRRQLVGQLLTESLVLALVAGAASLLIANMAIEYLGSVQFASDLPISITLRLDQRALIYSLAVSLASVVFFGLGPALRGSKADVAASLKTGESNEGRRRMYGRNVLVIAQVSISMMLLAGACLFFESFLNTLLRSPGFRTDHLLLMTFDPSLVRYQPAQAERFYHDLTDRVRQLPGVRNAAITQSLPFGTNFAGKEIVPEGKQLPPGKTADSVFSNAVGDGYFETMETRIVAGRGFRSTDTADAPRVAVINQVLAQRYWPKENAVGKRFRIDGPNGQSIEIVGVAQTAKYIFVAEGPLPCLYLPERQAPSTRMSFLVQTAGAAGAIAEPVRQAVRSFDSQMPMFDVRTMRDYYRQRAVSIMQMIVVVVGSMGLLGLTLALIGLYGLVAYSVSRRTREIGIRMAVGAQWRDILRMVLRQGLVLAAIGVAVGILGSFGLIRALAALFEQTSTRWLNAWEIVAMPIVVFALTMAACYIPARRAARIDPNQALHYE